jgi:hypothetical protein
MHELLQLSARLVFAAYCITLASGFLQQSSSSTGAPFIVAFAFRILDVTCRRESAR